MSLGPWEILILVALALLVFGGRGKISQIMGDFGKGLKNFKQNIKDERKSDKPLDDAEPESTIIDAKPVEVGANETTPEKANANKN